MNGINLKNLFLGAFVILLLVMAVNAARLPTVSGDSGSWGTVLNGYLSVALNSSSGYLNVDSVNSTFITGQSINSSHLNLTNAGFGNVINSTHITNGDNGVQLADMAASSVNSTHIVNGAIVAADLSGAPIINATHITAGSVNQSHVSIAANLSISGLNVSSTTQQTNHTGMLTITKMKQVLNVSSESGASSFNITDGDVNVNSTVLLTLGVNGTSPGNYSCGVVNVSVRSFAVQCSNGVGTLAPFRFNYLLINVESP